MVPALESERLILRAWRKDDSPAVATMPGKNLPSQAVAKRLGAIPLSPTTSRGEPRLRFRHRLPV